MLGAQPSDEDPLIGLLDTAELAGEAAERIGHRVQLWSTSFAPASVHMQATYAYAVQREPGKALKSARKLDLGDLPGTISRGRHLRVRPVLPARVTTGICDHHVVNRKHA